MVAMCSEGDGVKVDNGSMTMTKSLRKRTMVACSEAGVEAVECTRAGDKAAACSEVRIKHGRWQKRRGSI
jgi:hypothetical protein